MDGDYEAEFNPVHATGIDQTQTQTQSTRANMDEVSRTNSGPSVNTSVDSADSMDQADGIRMADMSSGVSSTRRGYGGGSGGGGGHDWPTGVRRRTERDSGHSVHSVKSTQEESIAVIFKMAEKQETDNMGRWVGAWTGRWVGG